MTLYTARYRLLQEGGSYRGWPYGGTTWHLEFTNESYALGAWNDLKELYADSAVGQRLVCDRNGPVHEARFYRRSAEMRREWTLLRSHSFSLPNMPSIGLEIPIGDGSIPVTAAQAFTQPDARRSVMIKETAANGSSRRVYIGPLSPVALVFSLLGDIPLFDGAALTAWSYDNSSVIGPLILLAGGKPTGDSPFDPLSERNDRWRQRITDLCIDHASDIDQILGSEGQRVVVSWKNQTVSPVEETVAAPIAAELRSRSRTLPFARRGLIP